MNLLKMFRVLMDSGEAAVVKEWILLICGTWDVLTAAGSA